MATQARLRRKRENRGFISWEEQQKEKKIQKTLENYDKEEDNEQR